MATKKRLIAYDPITFESFTRHATKHREPYDQYDMGYVDAIDNIENWLEANAVDAVEVVRCKDCKCYNTRNCADGFGWCEGYNRGMMDNDFCSNGARMDGDGNA